MLHGLTKVPRDRVTEGFHSCSRSVYTPFIEKDLKTVQGRILGSCVPKAIPSLAQGYSAIWWAWSKTLAIRGHFSGIIAPPSGHKFVPGKGEKNPPLSCLRKLTAFNSMQFHPQAFLNAKKQMNMFIALSIIVTWETNSMSNNTNYSTSTWDSKQPQGKLLTKYESTPPPPPCWEGIIQLKILFFLCSENMHCITLNVSLDSYFAFSVIPCLLTNTTSSFI